MERVKAWVANNSLWIVAVGLMLASSGIDGVYLSLWMPTGWAWLGLVLNTMADIASPIISNKFGKLQQDPAKRRLSWGLLGAEIVALFYSWFFSWRQLLRILPLVEPEAYMVIAPIAAGFIPLLLAFVGYAESLDQAHLPQVEPKPFECPVCHRRFRTKAARAMHEKTHAKPKPMPGPEPIRQPGGQPIAS